MCRHKVVFSIEATKDEAEVIAEHLPNIFDAAMKGRYAVRNKITDSIRIEGIIPQTDEEMQSPSPYRRSH